MDSFENTAPWVVSILSLCITASTIWFNHRNSDLNRKKDVLSGNRMFWITTLRTHVAEFISEHMVIYSNNSIEDSTTRLNRLRKVTLLKYKIELLLNPEEEYSISIISLMKQMNQLNSSKEEADRNNRYQQAINRLVEEVQSVLKEEWIRVKNLE